MESWSGADENEFPLILQKGEGKKKLSKDFKDIC